MSNATYKIKLTPVGRFFFGGEVVFGNEGAQEERRRSYLVHSNLLPQQTSLLGMVREEILRHNSALLPPGASTNDRQKASDLVGTTGFKFATSTSNTPHPGYGVIEQISPLALEDETGRHWQPLPLDDQENGKGEAFKWEQEGDYWLLDNYKPKEGLNLMFGTSTGDRKTLSDCFVKQEQVGITITNRNHWRTHYKSDQEAFFRQSSFRNGYSQFREKTKKKEEPTGHQFSFIFWLRLRKDKFPDKFQSLQNTLVHLGGERSQFCLEIEEAPSRSKIEEYFQPLTYWYNKELPPSYRRILLLSDAYIKTKELEKFGVFTLANPVSFRFFSSNLMNTERFYNLTPDQTAIKGRYQSKQFQLLQRGGVLLLEKSKLSNVRSIIESQDALRSIGYNYFLYE